MHQNDWLKSVFVWFDFVIVSLHIWKEEWGWPNEASFKSVHLVGFPWIRVKPDGQSPLSYYPFHIVKEERSLPWSRPVIQPDGHLIHLTILLFSTCCSFSPMSPRGSIDGSWPATRAAAAGITNKKENKKLKRQETLLFWPQMLATGVENTGSRLQS